MPRKRQSFFFHLCFRTWKSRQTMPTTEKKNEEWSFGRIIVYLGANVPFDIWYHYIQESQEVSFSFLYIIYFIFLDEYIPLFINNNYKKFLFLSFLIHTYGGRSPTTLIKKCWYHYLQESKKVYFSFFFIIYFIFLGEYILWFINNNYAHT